MLPVGSRPFLDRVIEEYASHDLRSFTLLAGWCASGVFKAYAEWGQWRGLNIEVLMDQKLEGTLSALRLYLTESELLPNKFLLGNGDTLIQTDTRPQNFYGRALAFRINKQDCGLRMFNTDALIPIINNLHPMATSIEKDLFPTLSILRWQNLDKDSSRFIDIGTPENYERAQVIFR